MPNRMSRNARKRNFRNVRHANIQTGLCIRTVWLESSLGAIWIAKYTNFLHADYEDSDQSDLNLSWAHMSKVRFLSLRFVLFR